MSFWNVDTRSLPFNPLKVAIVWSLAYVVVGGIWISLSNRMVARLQVSPEQLMSIQTYMGWAFVVLTGVLIFSILLWTLHRRERLYQELRDREKRLLGFISTLPGMTYRRRNDQNWTMLFASDYCRELTGYSPDDLVVGNQKIAWNELIHPEDRKRIWEEIQHSLEEKEPFGIRYRILTANGKEKWVKEAGRLLTRRNGEGDVLEGFIIDITHERELEEQLSRAQRLEALGSLAAGLAHDFNNVLLGIEGHAHLLWDEVEDNEQASEDVQTICDLVEQSATMIRQLLTFSRGQSIDPVELDLNSHIRNLLRVSKRTMRENILIETDLAPDPVKVKADPGQMEQLLMNLVINATDAMPEGGRLIIETAIVTLNEKAVKTVGLDPGKYAHIRVEDSGHGMDESILQKIFDPFFTTKGDKGTGLGLSTVYGIVRQHKGRIEVKSKPKEGSTFTVLLPATSE